MTDAMTISHRDVARALGATLAVVREQSRATDIAAEVREIGAGDEFAAALLTAFATFNTRKVADPEAYLLQWVAFELNAADAQDGPPDGPQDAAPDR